MDCKTLTEIFAGERESDLTEAESVAFDAHLNACPQCLQALAGAEDEIAPLTEWTAPEPSAEQWERVTSRVQLELASPNGRVVTPWTKTPIYLAVAAAALFVVGVTLLFASHTSQPVNRAGTAFINDDDPAPNKDGIVDGGDSPDASDGGVDSAVDEDRPDAEVLQHSGENGHETEVVIFDGVPCVVIRERAS